MGDIIDVISGRKSIRRYTDEPIPDELLDKILEAARWAPSGENEQPWKLIVIKDPETRVKIGEIARIGSGQRVTAEYCRPSHRSSHRSRPPPKWWTNSFSVYSLPSGARRAIARRPRR